MPATSIFINAASAGMSGIGYSRISVLLGPTRTAASTLSATETPPMIDGGQSRTGPGPVKVIFARSAADLKFLHRVPRVRLRNFKSKSGTRIIELLVPFGFRSSYSSLPRCITNFENRALVSLGGRAGGHAAEALQQGASSPGSTAMAIKYG